MPDQAASTPIVAAYAAQRRPLSIDAAVRAALSYRPAERRSFGNEDDLEGPRPPEPDRRRTSPAP